MTDDVTEALARERWNQREEVFAWLMRKLHKTDMPHSSWDNASEEGKDLIRDQVRCLYQNRKVN